MLRCFNNVVEGEIPERWCKSRTKMIGKENKPSVNDFRPIAVTNITYKIFMAIMRDRIERHLKLNNLIKDNQLGFTEGGRLEYNHIMMQYIVEQIYKGKEGGILILMALDFKKAYDSINRKKMIETLIK